MKVIRLTTSLDYGGQERQYISFTEATPQMLHNEYIFAAIGHGGYAEEVIRKNGFEVVIFNKNPKITNLKNSWILYKWFKKIKPDVVHTAAAEANFHGIIAAKLAGVPIIIGEEIGFPNHSTMAKWVFKQLYKLTYKVICVSNAVKEYLICIQEINNEKAVVIYNPVSPIKTNLKNLPNEFTLISIGRLEKVKNHVLLIKSLYKLRDKNTKLILVGEGSERKNLENLVNKLNLQDRVTFTGFVQNPEKYIARAHLFVLPSLSEGFGIAVVEAMQQNIACMCSNIGGIPEFITHKETGWLFDPNNEKELVNQLNEIIAMPSNDIEKIANNAKMSVEDRFTIEKYVKILENLYCKNHD